MGRPINVRPRAGDIQKSHPGQGETGGGSKEEYLEGGRGHCPARLPTQSRAQGAQGAQVDWRPWRRRPAVYSGEAHEEAGERGGEAKRRVDRQLRLGCVKLPSVVIANETKAKAAHAKSRKRIRGSKEKKTDKVKNCCRVKRHTVPVSLISNRMIPLRHRQAHQGQPATHISTCTITQRRGWRLATSTTRASRGRPASRKQPGTRPLQPLLFHHAQGGRRRLRQRKAVEDAVPAQAHGLRREHLAERLAGLRLRKDKADVRAVQKRG